MAPIDPAQLLKALSPLLSTDGGIKDATEVQRLSSLMKRFSRKLVSRCIYCCVLKATAPEILEIYLERDGWDTLLLWIGEAKDNPSFLKELIALLDKLPMTVERLKANNIAKIVKGLGKHEDPILAQQAETLVSKWVKLIKAAPDEKEHTKDKEREKDKDKEKEKDMKDKDRDKDREKRKERKNRENNRGDKEKEKGRRHDDDKKKDEKDRHKSSSSSHKTSSSSRSEKDKDRDRDRKERRDRERDKVRSDRDRDKDRSSSRRDKDTTGEKRKDVDDKEDKAQKKLRTAAEDSDQASGFNQQASVDAEDLSDVVPPRPPTPPEIRKPKMERPKTVKEFGSKLRLASFLEDDNGPPLKKKITKSLATSSSVLNKPSVPSVSRMRNLSGPSGVRASLMSAHMNQTEQQVGNIKLIAPKASHLIMENEGFMNALNASNHAEKPGLIKKKKKVGGDKKAMDGARRENSRDESGEEGAGPDGEGNKDISSTDDVRTEFNDEVKSESSESEPVQAAKEESGVAPISEPPKLSFYKDTLEETTDEESKPLRRSLRNRTRKTIIEQDSDEEEGHEKDKLASENTKVERMEDEASQESTSSNSQEATSSVDNAASAKVDETVETEEEGIPVILQTLPEPSSNTSGVKSILTIVTNKNKVKKSVRWKEEGELKAFYYFENDPNERINVNNANHMAMQQGQIGQMGMDIKMIEMRMERERLRAPNDRMEEQQTWRMPPIIDIPPERAPSLQSEEIGRASEMRHVEAARQATVLEVIYFSRHMVPDSAVEPEPENRRPSDAVEVKVIPLEDVEAVPEENTWTEQTPSGVATELPPALTNLFANIANQSGEAPGLSLPKMPPEIPIIPQGPPEHFPMGPAPPMPPLGGHPDMSMPGPLGPPFMPPNGGPQGPLPMVPIIPDQESGGHWGPMQSGPGPGPGTDMLHHQGPPGGPGSHHDRTSGGSGGGSGNERRQRGTRGGGRPQIRGPPRTLCKFFKQGHCRFGGGCSFLHPGVNGPDIR